ncbi:MAG TPA: hypothetical protein VNT76_11200, partial [Candidatus Binatus sp.]|nr:hypothetical protein [Candidatus Binatus sp.]
MGFPARSQSLTIEVNFGDYDSILLVTGCTIKRLKDARFKGTFVRKSKTPQRKVQPRQSRAHRSQKIEPIAESLSASPARPAPRNINLTLKHFQRRRENT